MKIIFLDIDGVICVDYIGHDEFGMYFQPHFVDNLKRLIEKTGAKIVMSSTWRYDGLEYVRKLWKDRNLPGEIIDITPNINIFKRGAEIKSWLETHKDLWSNYVILDDDLDFFDLPQLEEIVRKL